MPAKDCQAEAATTKKKIDDPEMAHQKPTDGLAGMMHWGAGPREVGIKEDVPKRY